MLPDQKFTFDDLMKAVIVKRYLVIGSAIIFSAVVLVVGLISPRVYQAEAIVILPETPRNGIYADSKGNIKALINVLETKNLVGLHWKRVSDGMADTVIGNLLVPYIRSISIEDIKGSNSQFRLVVQVERDQSKGLRAIDAVMSYLHSNEYVNRKYEAEEKNLQSALTELQVSIDKATVIRENALRQIQGKTIMGFNPIEMESKISDLRLRYSDLQTNRALFHGYEYVMPPYCFPSPIKPAVLISVLMSAIVGIVAGVMTVIIQQLVKARRSGNNV